MLPEARVLKVGERSVIYEGNRVVYPLVDALSKALHKYKLVIGTGGGARTRHVFSIGLDLGLATGVLAGPSIADVLGSPYSRNTVGLIRRRGYPA
jgi:molybdenum storage protein